MKLKNILIVVKDIEKSKQFYNDLFGLDLVLDNDGILMQTILNRLRLMRHLSRLLLCGKKLIFTRLRIFCSSGNIYSVRMKI